MPEINIDETNPKGRPSIAEAALSGLCPKCGSRTLFKDWVSFVDRCKQCDLDISRFNVGDGAAAFLTMIIGALVVGSAVWLQLSVGPPWWVHVILWLPLTTAAVIFGLRIAKAALLAAEYGQGAGAASIAPDASTDEEE